jgi:hypothetical protein
MFGFLCSGVDASRWGLGTMFLRSLPFLLFAHDSLASILAREDELPGTAHKMFAGIPPPSCMRWPPTRRANEMITDLRSFRWRPPWACVEDSSGGVKNNVRQVVVSGIQGTAVTGPGGRILLESPISRRAIRRGWSSSSRSRWTSRRESRPGRQHQPPGAAFRRQALG